MTHNRPADHHPGGYIIGLGAFLGVMLLFIRATIRKTADLLAEASICLQQNSGLIATTLILVLAKVT